MNDVREGDATGTPGRLWLIDWRGSPRARAMLHAALRLSARLEARPDALVLYAPGGGAADLRDILPDVPRRSVFDWLTERGRRAADDRTLSISRHVVPLDAPTTLGLGDRLLLFNALDLQDSLRRFAQMSAVCRGAATQGATAIRLFTLDRALADALVSDAAEYGGSIRASRWLAGVAALASSARRTRPPATAAPVPSTPALPPSPIVLVSWTRPMDVMMAALHDAAASQGRTDIMHLHHATASVSPAAHCRPLPADVAHDADALAAAMRAAAEPRLPPGGAGIVLRGAIADARPHLAQQEAHFEAVGRWLTEVSPRAVVVGNDRWWVGSAWVLAARERGLPTLCVQDGIAADMPQWRWLTADRIATNGRHLKRLLEADGLAAERAVVVGQPRYDAMLRPEPAARTAATRAALELPGHRTVLLFATQYGQDAPVVRHVVEQVLRVPELFLLLRPHPSEDQTLHRALAASAPPERMALAAEVPIDQLLHCSDAVAVQSSSVAFEAEILGRPLLLVDFTGQPMPDSFSHLRAERVTDEAQLAPALRRLARVRPGDRLPPPDDPEYIGPLDGACSARTLAAIDTLLPGRPVDA